MMRLSGKSYCRSKIKDCPWVPGVSSSCCGKNPALSSSGPEIGPVSRHFQPLAQSMCLSSCSKLSLCSRLCPSWRCTQVCMICQGTQVAARATWLLWRENAEWREPASAWVHVIERARDRGRERKKREEERVFVKLRFYFVRHGKDQAPFKLAFNSPSFGRLAGLALILPLINPCPRSSGALCPLCSPVVFPG